MRIIKKTTVTLLWKTKQDDLITALQIGNAYRWKFFFASNSQDGKFKNGDEVPKEICELTRRKAANEAAREFDETEIFGNDPDPGMVI